jgi:hypothetical protein
MNGAIQCEYERVNGKIQAKARFPHQSSLRLMTWPDGTPKEYATALDAQKDIYATGLRLLTGGCNKIRGTQDGIPKRHTVESVFGKGA